MGGRKAVINYMRDAVDGKHQLTVLVPDVFESNWRYAAKLMNIPPNQYFIAVMNVVSREIYKHFSETESYGTYAKTVDKVFEEHASFSGITLDA